MSWVNVAGAAVGVVGSLFNDSGGTTQTTQNTLDPRIARYMYGDSGSGGLLSNVNNLYAQQMGQGGLNPMQNAGLEMQRQTLLDPRYTQGFDQMRNLGSGLLSQGVAGNPFTGGQTAFGHPNAGGGYFNAPGRMQAGGAGGLVHATGGDAGSPTYGQHPDGLLAPAYQPIQQQTAPAPVAGRTQADLDELIRQQQTTSSQPPSWVWNDSGDKGGE